MTNKVMTLVLNLFIALVSEYIESFQTIKEHNFSNSELHKEAALFRFVVLTFHPNANAKPTIMRCATVTTPQHKHIRK